MPSWRNGSASPSYLRVWWGQVGVAGSTPVDGKMDS